MKKPLLLTSFFLLIFHFLQAQQTLTVTTGPRWRDAMIYRDTRSGYEYLADENYGDYPRLSATAWTHSASPTYRRSFMHFSLDTIPAGSQVHSATLYFYSDPAITGSTAWNGNSQYSGSNAFYLERVTGEWHESTVTWNNQPSTTTSGRVWVGTSTSTTENRQVNLTAIVQSWVNNPLSNSGLMMRLENELYYRSRNYASSHHPDANLHPKLVISYTPPSTADGHSCGTPDPSEEDYMNIPWYGDENYLPNFYDSLEQAQNNSQPTANRLLLEDIERPWLRVPIKLWVYRQDDGTDGGNDPLPNEQRIQRMMDDLNNSFRRNGIKLRFYLEDIGFVNKTGAINVGGFGEQYRLAYSNRDLDALNIHIVDELEGSNGVFNPLHNVIFVERDVGDDAAAATTFTHEVGHYFGLMHTHMFKGIPCLREPVTRERKLTACPGVFLSPRCTATGDLLCDTDADPDMRDFGQYNAANCTWDPQGLTDWYNDPYHPDSRNIMAYGNQSCRSNLSTGQRNVIYFYAFMRQYKHTWIPTADNRFDRFEPDDSPIAARPIELGISQAHSFHVQGRRDEVDWLSFTHSGSVGNYILEVSELDASAVGDVEIFLDDGTETPATRVTGTTSAISGSTTTYTIPCQSLTVGNTYVIAIPRGSAGTDEYEVVLRKEAVGNIPTISGASTICYANTTFTLNNLPAGASVSWTRSNNLTYVSGNGTASYTVKAASSTTSGAAWVEAVYNLGCGNSDPIRHEFWIGKPGAVTTSPSGSSTIQLAPGQTKTVYATSIPGASSSSLKWWISGGSGLGILSKGSNNVVVEAYSSGYYYLKVTSNNSCGESATRIIPFEVSGGGSGDCGVYPNPPCEPYLAAYPNPNQGVFTVEIDEYLTAPKGDKFRVIILDNSNNVIYDKYTAQRKVNINLQHTRKGWHYLLLQYKEGTLSTKIKIE